MTINVLPLWQPDFVVDLVADGLALLRGKIRRVQDEKETAKINLGRCLHRASTRQHLGDRLARLKDRVESRLGVAINHLVGLHCPRDRASVVADEPRNPHVGDERAANLHRLAEMHAAHERVLQRVEDRNQPRRDADIEWARRRVRLGQHDMLPRPLVNRRAVTLRQFKCGKAALGFGHGLTGSTIFFGRPPFLPFAFAVVIFAYERDRPPILPPFLPRATACWFFILRSNDKNTRAG